jgi:transketolase
MACIPGSVREINGHDHDEIENALRDIPFEKDKPSVIIAHTIKGKGVSYMENELAWHYRSPNAEQLRLAIEEIESTK